ncbi:hypothetical protein HAX54_006244 [Datura stramonium]|uniref:Putative plant transposon protein domain-containing protein n=1 Tax=Datura stramonium TaxID=4076 RepID=A0ABS8TBE0_DATST|nr:hypothetical protein [Datura stramonium]
MGHEGVLRAVSGGPYISKCQKWEFLLLSFGRYCQTLVQEFYVTYGATLQAANPGLRSLIEPFNYVKLRGIQIDINPEEINRYYMGADYATIETTIYNEKVKSRVSVWPWMAKSYCYSSTNVGHHSHRSYLQVGPNAQAKFLWNVMISHICPMKRGNTLTHGQTLVIADNMDS